ncbi:radical SAM protein [Pyrobaculum neutrophilum]|uniref:radical SAM protein n=1 Tax=Pyrobaculum neutrophilum TaxID=70771 RepID=UPI000161670A|nr:radical SAM protein [Pyrobaculum neutrophilum]
MITHAAAHVVERFVGRLSRSPADPRRHAAALRRFEGRFGLYIHIPFCRSLCRFCSFVRYPYDPALYRRYKAALEKELQFLAEAAEGAKVDVLYVGGGTPTVDVYALAEILEVAKSHFGRLDISVEANPADVTDESISVLKEAGVERLSIGLQSLYDAKLAELGRRSHTAAQGAQAARLAAGRFPTVNIDMIWGTRLDTPATLRREAALALSLGVGQVTFYPLMPAPGLRKTLRQRREGPWHPQEEALYGAVLETASERGYPPPPPPGASAEPPA